MKLLAAVALISGALTGLTLAQEATILSVKITETTFQQNRVDPVAFVVGLVRSANTGFTEDIDIKAELAITSIPAANVDALVARAADLDPTYAPVNFNSWFSVILVGKTEDGKKKVHPEDNGVPRREVIDELVKKLAQMPEVESVEFIVEAIPAAPVFPSDDPRTVDQGYLNTAALGVDARYAWERPGGDGEFASVVDVEWDWLLDHEDLAAANISIINPPLQRHSNAIYTDHGTAVMGEIFMVDNTKGGVGIAPKARARVSQVKENVVDAGLNAIFAAIDKMEFGEIMLIEMQASADTTVGSRQSPIEVYERDFQALRLATALGITVIEAGGNGGHDLDNPISVNGLPPRRSLNRNHADFRDSGAIVVGGSTKEVPHRRREGTGGDNEATNFGNRIDAYSWFEGIVTTAFSAQSNAAYQDGFGGTSGASPIVAGVAAVIQSMVQANLGFKISPLQMRRLIIMSGTSTANPAFDKLGLMPNLRGLIDGQYLNLPPDVYVRDVVGDDGNPRSGAITYASPDIITRQTQVANPTAQFGAGSGQENNDALSQTVLEGRENFIYIRARNRGSRTAQQVFADVYWTEASTVLNHNQESWRPVGRTMFSSGVGNVLTVSNALRWQAPAGVRDPILIAILGAEEDPATMPPEANFPSTVELSRFFHQNNNVAGKGTRT